VLHAESDARIGGKFRVRFRMLDGSEHESSGEFLEVSAPRRLVMSWRWMSGGEPAEGEAVSRVEIDLKVIDSGTELTFTHAQLKSAVSKASHEQGWSGALDKLERLFESSPAA
jgi:uncharacterized protein YndB with AHSA1/START domain